MRPGTRGSTLSSRTKAGVALAVVVPFVLLVPGSAVTAVAGGHNYHVTTTADTHDARPDRDRCRDSSGQCSLRAAIEEANAQGRSGNVSLEAVGPYQLPLGQLKVTGGMNVYAGTAVIDAPATASSRSARTGSCICSAGFSRTGTPNQPARAAPSVPAQTAARS